MTKVNLEGALAALRAADSFLLTTHTGPDGDAVGSVLGLYHFLRSLGKDNITCACQDPVPRVYRWMPGADEIRSGKDIKGPYDLVVIIDVAQFARIGDIAEAIAPGQEVLILDHHREEEPDGTAHFIDYTYSSASEIVLELFDQADIPMTRSAAECIYVGLTTDTGGFRYGNTNARSHTFAARLIEAGVDVSDISARVFDTLSVPKLELLKRVLGRITVSESGLYAYAHLNDEDMSAASASPEDADGLINYIRNIEGVRVGMFFRELEPNLVKVSLRSRGEFNSAETLKSFGGGGHAGAAGATLDMSFPEARDAIVDAVRSGLGEGA